MNKNVQKYRNVNSLNITIKFIHRVYQGRRQNVGQGEETLRVKITQLNHLKNLCKIYKKQSQIINKFFKIFKNFYKIETNFQKNLR